MDLDLNNSRTLTILVIVVLILFAIVYVWINRDGFNDKEGFINYPVGAGDIVQLQGGLNNVQVGSNNTSLENSINNLIQQALTTFSTSVSYPKLVGVMNYTVANKNSCVGINAIKHLRDLGLIPENILNRTSSGFCLFNWSTPEEIMYDPTTKSTMEIMASFNPNVNTNTKNNIFNDNNIEKNKQHLVDVSFTLWSSEITCEFNVYLLTFDNNNKVINKLSVDRIGNYFINENASHKSFNLKFIVPVDNNMKNWGIYLFNSNRSADYAGIIISYNDTVSIAVYTI